MTRRHATARSRPVVIIPSRAAELLISFECGPAARISARLATSERTGARLCFRRQPRQLAFTILAVPGNGVNQSEDSRNGGGPGGHSRYERTSRLSDRNPWERAR